MAVQSRSTRDTAATAGHEASELYPRLLRRSPLTETLFILFTYNPTKESKR